MEKKFKMKHANNGYVLEGNNGDIVYQETDFKDKTDMERFISFLYEVADAYGPDQSSYGEQIRIVCVPGRKNDKGWEDLKECPVCHSDISKQS